VTPFGVAGMLLILTDLAGNLVRLPLFAAGGKSAPLLPLDLVVAAVLLLGVLAVRQTAHLRIDPVGKWAALFTLVALVSLASTPLRLSLAFREVLFASAYLVRWLAYFGIYVCVAEFMPAADAVRLARLLRLGIVGFALFGIVQVIALPGFAQLVYPDASVYLDWDPQGHRLVSTFLDPNFAGMLLVIGGCLWVGAWLAADRAPAWEGLVLGVALLLTLSRSSLLAAVAAMGTLILIRGLSGRLLGVTIGAMLLGAGIVPWLLDYAGGLGKLTVDASALQRLLAWQRAVQLVTEHPVLGIGFNTVGFVATRFGWSLRGAGGFGLDGGLLFVAALTGLAGLACFVGMLTAIIRSARRSWRATTTTPAHRGIAYAAAASVAAVTVHAFFANTLLLSLIMAPCWLLWALPRALRRDVPVHAATPVP
jgi:hypothetical protein